MGETTAIEWATGTFNAWEGCARVSEACKFCYAEARAHRFGHEVWGKGAPRMLRSDSYWRQPLRWNAAAKAEGVPRRIFCASLADVFDEHQGPMVLPDGTLAPGRSVAQERGRLWALISETPWLIWLLLTKRPQNVARMIPQRWADRGWPANVWLGTTVEDQGTAADRLPHLLARPAALRFVSMEPLLGPVDIRPWIHLELGLQWVITGGESGAESRPSHPDWFRSLRDACVERRVPFLFKQFGNWVPATPGRWPVGAQRRTLNPDGSTYQGTEAVTSFGKLARMYRSPSKDYRVLDDRTWDEIPTVSVPAS